MDFDRHYVMWKYEPSHQVDQKTAEAFAAFMRAETKPEILCAAKKLHIVKDDGSVSLAMLEEIVQELVLVSRPRTKRVQQEGLLGAALRLLLLHVLHAGGNANMISSCSGLRAPAR